LKYAASNFVVELTILHIEIGGSIFVRNVDTYLPSYTTAHTNRR